MEAGANWVMDNDPSDRADGHGSTPVPLRPVDALLHCVPLSGLPLVDGFHACGPMKPVCLMHCRPSTSIFLKTMWLLLHIFMQVLVFVAHCKLYFVVLTFAHVGQIVLKQTLKNRSERGCK